MGLLQDILIGQRCSDYIYSRMMGSRIGSSRSLFFKELWFTYEMILFWIVLSIHKLIFILHTLSDRWTIYLFLIDFCIIVVITFGTLNILAKYSSFHMYIAFTFGALNRLYWYNQYANSFGTLNILITDFIEYTITFGTLKLLAKYNIWI